MEQEQIPFPPPKNGGPDNNNMKLVGINFAVFAGYCLILAVALKRGEWEFAAMVAAGIHGFICFVMAIVVKRWAWALAGLLLLIAGFSTCVFGLLGV
ncbi:hypothetical protein INP83_10155 [Mucilaginibacter sp. 21P]|uniref:hypothetical protein n=1 Tax=Mucilaginibacter sp. 21P TaxID=2778902 RepID=UPI001C55C0CE|nr:hypothetical protein [Mucilaginibacter sp. 21P]QXV67424.1 hypothetical protein INP83_10155 [Mucilaginibacter sp. 21P]